MELEEELEKFRLFRDQYFELNSKHSADQRREALNARAKEILQKLEEDDERATSSGGEKTESKVRFNFLSGKVLNILPDFDQKCEDILSRTVKLDPNHSEAWNELGECLWKKGDFPGSRRCFETSLSKSRNSAALSNLAMVLRQEPAKTPEEKRDQIRKSLSLAKEACVLDPEDTTSLYMLGTAYLAYFFYCGQREFDIAKSIDAYSRAIVTKKENFNVDLFYNYSRALTYEEEYEQAIVAMERAVMLDPEFTGFQEKLQNLKLYLLRVQECVSRKGKMKPKKLLQLIQSIKPEKDLGSYSGGSFRSNNGKTVELSLCSFRNLKAGQNLNKVVVGKVVGLVVNEETIPYTFAIVDLDGECVCMTVYNFSGGFGVVIGDSVALPEPYVVEVDMEVSGKKCCFRSLRVPSPEVLLLNGMKAKKNVVAYTEVSLSTIRN